MHKKTPFGVPRFHLAGVAGFEPTHARVKVSCLTAWLHPNIKKTKFLLVAHPGFGPGTP